MAKPRPGQSGDPKLVGLAAVLAIAIGANHLMQASSTPPLPDKQDRLVSLPSRRNVSAAAMLRPPSIASYPELDLDTLPANVPQATVGLANTHPDDGECMRWAAEGQCQSNPAFMLASCLLGCNLEEHATPLDRTLLTLHRYLWALPGLFLQFFLVLFVFFFGLFYVLQKLIQRRNDQAAGLAHVAWAEERLVRR